MVVGGAQSSMTELSGMLGGVGLPALLRFLSGLQKTGRLHLSQDGWSGEVHFHVGEVTGATLGSRTGLAALDGMVELFPEAAFDFDARAAGGSASERTIQLSRDELQQHVDATAARIADGARRLPRPDAVPTQTAGDAGAEEPLPLDRGTLQTLLAVDGHRSVREIVAMRHSIESVWHLAGLADVGLIHFNVAPTSSAPTTDEDTSSMPTLIARAPTVDLATQETIIAPLFGPVSATPMPAPRASAVPVDADHCPKLGFDDDPANAFGRPTRLHRCFAAGSPMPVSLDQQRELCLSDHFGSCPRLTGEPPASSPSQPQAQPQPQPRGAWPARRIDASTRGDARIVRLPFGARVATTDRDAAKTAPSTPTPLRSTPSRARADASDPTAAAAAQPTPLRARPAWRASTAATAVTVPPGAKNAATATTVPSAAVGAPPDNAPRPPFRHAQARAAAQVDRLSADGRGRIGQIPVVALAAAAVVVLLIAALGYLVLPQLFGDTSVDDGSLPNARRAAEGTPVTALVQPRATPVAVGTPGTGSDSDVDVDGAQLSQSSAAAAQPTSAPSAGQGLGAPAAAQSSASQPSANPTSAGAAAAGQPAASGSQPAAGSALLDDRFASNAANWPSNPQGVAQFTNGTYRIATRQAGQSATVGAPLARVPGDVQVTADFRKLGGPDGGGYGIIVRDQQQGVRDGSTQDGRYYVLEAGDKGEIGIWRRDGDHWVDLVPWQHADAVRPGTAPNELSVRAVGDALTLLVNGTQVATRQDAVLSNGQVGLFVGGDGNQVAVSRFTVQNP
jgi:hypothetical protein